MAFLVALAFVEWRQRIEIGAHLLIGSGCSGSSILLIESAGRGRPGVPNLGLGDRRGNRIEARQSISGSAGRPI